MKTKVLLFKLASLGLLNCSIAVASDIDSAERLRTLFTTAGERQQLDQMRDSGRFSAQQQTSNTSSIIRPPLTVKLQGLVLRNGHKPVVFVNNKNNLKSNQLNRNIRVRSRLIKASQYQVPLRILQQGVRLKPGQQWNETTRQVKDNFQIKARKLSTEQADVLSPSMDNSQREGLSKK